MPMRHECRNFQSRTYASGEVARFCVLDLAPEAPWRCPENCSAYAPRTADVGWSYGSLVPPRTPEEPEIIELNDDAAALLDEAEDIVGMAGADIVAEVQRARERARAASPSVVDRLRARFRRR